MTQQDDLSFAREAAARDLSPVLRIERDGRIFWIKRAAPPKRGGWHVVQGILARLFRAPALRATAGLGGSAALLAEAGRMRRFRELGVPVPEVFACDGDVMLTADLGPQLKDSIDAAPDAGARTALLENGARALAALHRAGLAHGRPYLRDMTWDGARVGFLDLEEDPAAAMPLALAQARDVFVFLSSSARYAEAAGLELLFSAYAEAAPPEVFAALPEFLRPLAVLRIVHTPFLWRRVGGDARRAAVAAGVLGRSSGRQELYSHLNN